ncbi:type II secretion system protein GspM [Ramlibacter sp. PS4R-6]|uniref:type II secretion system protein GspM n=1 Tax=Ramlibacter sp. PS4R-6 TaxID=3133438 RepID=UPI0030A72912
MNAAVQALRARWAALAPREKAMVAAAVAVVAFALVWVLAIGPALATLRGAEEQRRALDLQVQHMANLQAQAQSLQSQPKLGRDEAVRQLELSVRQRLGTTARVLISGDRVTVTLAGTQADALAQWLAQARATARSLPAEAHLTRNAGGTWEGNIVLALPRP